MSDQLQPVPDMPDFYTNWRLRVYTWLEERSQSEIADAVMFLPDLLALVIRLLRDPRTPLFFKTQLLLVAIYVVLPVDLVPEAIFGAAGLADDVLIVSVMLLRLLHSAAGLDESLLRQHWAGGGDLVGTLHEVVEGEGEIINPRVWNQLRRLFGASPKTKS